MWERPSSVTPIRVLHSNELTGADWESLDDLWASAFKETVPEDYWELEIGPARHFLREVDDRLVSHACIIERMLHAGPHHVTTGYVEAVATYPEVQQLGHASAVMGAIGDHIRAHFQLGALATGSNSFYERLGWETWRGPTYYRKDGRLFRTAEEDGNVMILRTPTTPDLDVRAPISVAWRLGEVW
jgi:aminoglycoside 2'-N-acetyltransferase I